MTYIEPPTSCPSCSSLIVVINNLLFCKNTSCGTKIHKKLEHFAKTLKIKGLGPKAIEKLGVTTSQELYLLTKDDLVSVLESEKIGAKLFAELQVSKNVPMNVVLPALSIPLIGNTAAKKLATVCDTVHDINADTCESAGLGPKATDNLLSYLSENDGLDQLLDHPFSFKFEKPQVVLAQKGVVCISGKLKSYKTKAEASEILQQNGYAIKASLTRDVTILVNESGIESQKTQKARDAGVQIITNLQQFLEN
jgi:NAD-dependent DNA ligase